MVLEIKKGLETGKISLGLKQTMKNAKNIKRVYVTSDCRKEIMNLLKEKGIEYEKSELSKSEISQRLELGFHCEVFGLTK